jgi:integrase
MKVKYWKSHGKKPWGVDLRKFGGSIEMFATKDEASNYMKSQMKQIEGVRVSRENKTEWTFQYLIDQYRERLKSRKNAHNKERSMFEFEQVEIDGIMLADMKVREFVVGDLDELLLAIKGNRSPKTQREVMAHFRQLLDFAVLKGCVSMNVFRQLASGLDYGDRDKKKLTQISEDVIHKIAKNIQPLGANSICQRKLMYLFSAYTGLRSGELRALEWSDVDFKNEEINVNKVVHYKRNYSVDDQGKRTEKGKFEIRHSTKTEKGMRNVPIVKWLASMLKEYKLQQGGSAPLAMQHHNRVFPSSTGGVLSGTRLREYLQEACERADVARIRWHDLRHYYASVLLKVYGGDFNRIKTYMGHASIKTTIDIYSHWIENDEEKQEAKDKLNKSLGKFGSMV